MKEPPSNQVSTIERIRSWLHPESDRDKGIELPSVLPTANSPRASVTQSHNGSRNLDDFTFPDPSANAAFDRTPGGNASLAYTKNEGQRSVMSGDKKKKKNVAVRFYRTTKEILFSSWVNVVLVFVPAGIVVEAVGANPTIIFVLNAIAIVPLAGLLSHATESVAKRMGDTVGALMNVTFGNSVELIIFIIALTKNEIRIVQASLLGSILANLLFILGMCFLFGGLRFREQIYNSTVTQMSACLLSLSVMSLLLPTAFHAAFKAENHAKADVAVLQVSRGTSVILLVVYALYLVFQLKSHAYMYQSTPQHLIDEESAPGPVAHWMDSSSGSSSSSSSSSNDSDGSHGTAAKIKRAIKRSSRRRRKSSISTVNTFDPALSSSRTVSYEKDNNNKFSGGASASANGNLDVIGDADVEDNSHTRRGSGAASRSGHNSIILSKQEKKSRKERKRQRKADKAERSKARKARKAHEAAVAAGQQLSEDANAEKQVMNDYEPRRVDFAIVDAQSQEPEQPQKNTFLKSIRPTLPKTLSQNVFRRSPTASPQLGATQPEVSGRIPRVRYGIRHTNSLPDRLNSIAAASAAQTKFTPALALTTSNAVISPYTEQVNPEDAEDGEKDISKTTAVILLLVSTGLVAVCAEFMVGSINEVTTNTALGETFVGLIILPIVGNAAEHVTAVTVATKNKMDLAIGVAVGSSIQIALFVTPFIVLLGWMMDKPMSLYFTLFETVCLFVSAFIVNFLVLDGRSNYLEGALLCAAYVIIAVAAFFYPAFDDQSLLGGNAEAGSKMVRSLIEGGGELVGWRMF